MQIWVHIFGEIKNIWGNWEILGKLRSLIVLLGLIIKYFAIAICGDEGRSNRSDIQKEKIKREKGDMGVRG